MKLIVATALAAFTLAMTATTASAADIRTCRSQHKTSDAPGFTRIGREVARNLVPQAEDYLGEQYTAHWMQPDDGGWYIGVAPGERSLAQVKTWLRARVRKYFKGEEARLIRSRLHVIRQPYGLLELNQVGNDIFDMLSSQRTPGNWSGDEACTLSDAFRVEITLYKDSSRATVRKVKTQLAEFGDRVRVTRVDHMPRDLR